MEIKCGKQKLRLYKPNFNYQEWFDSHSYKWQVKNRRYEIHPNNKCVTIWQNAKLKLLNKQGRAIKVFMKNCNGGNSEK